MITDDVYAWLKLLTHLANGITAVMEEEGGWSFIFEK